MEQLYAIATVWVITWRFAWPIILVLGFFAFLAAASGSSPAWRQQLPPPWLVPAMFFMPLVSIVWAGAFWAAEQSFPPSANHWRSISHNSFVILAIVVALGLSFWSRKFRRAWLTFICAVFVVLFSVVVWFVGAMAISNTWL
jgi:hypothetical protein